MTQGPIHPTAASDLQRTWVICHPYRFHLGEARRETIWDEHLKGKHNLVGRWTLNPKETELNKRKLFNPSRDGDTLSCQDGSSNNSQPLWKEIFLINIYIYQLFFRHLSTLYKKMLTPWYLHNVHLAEDLSHSICSEYICYIKISDIMQTPLFT